MSPAPNTDPTQERPADHVGAPFRADHTIGDQRPGPYLEAAQVALARRVEALSGIPEEFSERRLLDHLETVVDNARRITSVGAGAGDDYRRNVAADLVDAGLRVELEALEALAVNGAAETLAEEAIAQATALLRRARTIALSLAAGDSPSRLAVDDLDSQLAEARRWAGSMRALVTEERGS